MTGAELLSEAVAELYGSDLEIFIERRGVLAARARAAGELVAAKAISGLRKPTRSAWAVNQMVRADPSVPVRLAAMGDELRAAEAALDGTRILELSQARRQLVDALARAASRVFGTPAPSAALQEEVISTFWAALADPEVAGQLAAGTLLRPVQRAGFGSRSRPALALVPSPAGRRPPRAPAKPLAPAKPVAPAEPGTRPAAQAAAEKAGRERRRAIAAAEQALADASRAADTAETAEREQLSVVRRMEEQLADARQGLAGARLRARHAREAESRARRALDRLRG